MGYKRRHSQSGMWNSLATAAGAASRYYGLYGAPSKRRRTAMPVAQRSKFRGYGSRTQTSYRRRRSRRYKAGFGNSGTSSFTYKIGKKRPLRKGLNKSHLYKNSVTRLSESAGYQKVAEVATLYNKTDINAMIAQIPSYNDTTLLMSRGAVARSMFTNQSEVAVKVMLYDCIARHDGDDLVADCFNTGISDQTGGAAGNALVGLSPFKSGMFVKNWIARKVASFVLPPGAHHIHYCKARVNKTISNAWISKTPATVLRSVSYALLAVCHGMPINDVTTTTQISTAAVAVDVITTVSYDYTYDAHDKQKLTSTNVLPTAFTVNPSNIDLDGDANVPTVA